MAPRVTLDPRGDNLPALGTVVVRDEVALLEELLGKRPFWVQGERLCQWAAAVAQARDWKVEWLDSPVSELCRVCPGLADDQAKRVLESLGERLASLRRPLQAVDVAEQLWPDADLRPVLPDLEHAFRWLLWLANRELGAHELALIGAVASPWVVETAQSWSRVYETSDARQAWQYLKNWLRLSPTRQEWPSTPAAVVLPEWVTKRLLDEWRLEVVRTGGRFFQDLATLAPGPTLLKKAAEVTVEFLTKNPEALSSGLLEVLRPWIGVGQRDALLALLPPLEPKPPPQSFEEITGWFIQEYLPFRSWRGGGSPKQLACVADVTRDFASWFLAYYAESLAGGAGAEHLSWSKTSRLSQVSDGVTLLMVLDGLGYADAERFLKRVQEKSSRLLVDDFTLAIAPLPTVTEFAKPALLTGVNPFAALEETRLGGMEKRDSEVIAALNGGRPGAIVIWSLLEPDATYHRRLDSDTMRSEVDARLQSLADRLVRIAHATRDDVPLRVIVSTDHGRLLTNAIRCQSPPTGMKAHGRAAWGPANIRFGPDGFLTDGDIVYLHPERFHVPEVCAILLSDAAYLTTDGRGGQESYPHGGVYPEEVLIPWLQLSRDRGPVMLTVRLAGRGIAGNEGTLDLEVTNASEVRIRVQEFKINRIEQRFPLNLQVSPLSARTAQLELSCWPTAEECRELDAVLSYTLPNGEPRTIRAECSVVSDEMYRQDDILGDL